MISSVIFMVCDDVGCAWAVNHAASSVLLVTRAACQLRNTPACTNVPALTPHQARYNRYHLQSNSKRLKRLHHLLLFVKHDHR
jgi:hypothetical protein